jgi:phosphatidate cytidylyltransferase
MGKMHLKRWLTALIAIPILIYLVGFAPRWMFYGLLFLVSIAGLVEFYGIVAADLPWFFRWPTYGLTLLFFLSFYKGAFYFSLALIALWSFFPMTLFMLRRPSPEVSVTGDMGKLLLGPVYICLPLAMLMIVDRYPGGSIWILFLLTIVCANDTGAFYFGRIFGKHKLHKTVSPGKTWEGAIGGILSGLFGALLLFHILKILHVPCPYGFDAGTILLVLGLSVSAQIGDLAESMLKRNHGVKDSSGILPGHGGLLDRIDGILFSIPVVYVHLTLSIK